VLQSRAKAAFSIGAFFVGILQCQVLGQEKKKANKKGGIGEQGGKKTPVLKKLVFFIGILV
jgi:hypothetical protein